MLHLPGVHPHVLGGLGGLLRGGRGPPPDAEEVAQHQHEGGGEHLGPRQDEHVLVDMRRVQELASRRGPDEHGYGLQQQHEADGAGELLGAHDGHEHLELQGPHHAVGDAEEDAEDHQAAVVAGRGPREVREAVEEHGEAEEVDGVRPHPLQPRHEARRGPGEDVDEAEHGEQEGRPGVGHAQVLGVAHHEHGRHEEPQHHDGGRHGVDDEAAVPEDAQVQQPARRPLRPGPLPASGRLQGPHECGAHAAVEQQAAQDEEAAPPAVVVLQQLPQRRQGAQEHGAARRRQPVGHGAPLVEVAVEHDERGLEVERQTQAGDDPSGEVELNDASAEGRGHHAQGRQEAPREHDGPAAKAIHTHTAERACPVQHGQQDGGDPGRVTVADAELTHELLEEDADRLGEGVGEARDDETAPEDGPAPAPVRGLDACRALVDHGPSHGQEGWFRVPGRSCSEDGRPPAAGAGPGGLVRRGSVSAPAAGCRPGVQGLWGLSVPRVGHEPGAGFRGAPEP
uniref:Monocarboxylate transporter 4 n=1 Tax=Sus scrofa TaxID=9823 RepID=A0A480IY48_PIG